MKSRTSRQHQLHVIGWRLWCYWATLVLAAMQVMLILGSWIITSAMPEMPYRSLLSAAGVRWFFGNFTSKMASAELVYILVTCIGVGALGASGLWQALGRLLSSGFKKEFSSQQRYALRATGLLAVVEITVILCLTLMPHAVLLSVTGELFPSSFSVSLIPVVSFILGTCSVLYSLLSGRLHSVYEVGECLGSAGTWMMPIVLLYFLGGMFCHMVSYVFMI